MATDRDLSSNKENFSMLNGALEWSLNNQMEFSGKAYMYQSSNWKLNATLFQSNWTNGITIVPIDDPVLTSGYANVGVNQSRGLELTYRGQLNNWQWDLNGSYVKSEAVIASGNTDYVAFPKYIVNLNFGYHLPEHDVSIYLSNRLHFDVQAGPIVSNIPEPANLEDFQQTDINLVWAVSDNLKVNGKVQNVFDKNNFSPALFNAENGIVAKGRDLLIGLEYAF